MNSATAAMSERSYVSEHRVRVQLVVPGVEIHVHVTAKKLDSNPGSLRIRRDSLLYYFSVSLIIHRTPPKRL